MCVCVWVCNRIQLGTLYYQTGDVLKPGTVPTLRVSAVDCKSNEITLTNDEYLCAPVMSPVISELSYSYTIRPLLHVVHHSVPSPIACSIRIVYTVCHTVRGWEGLQVCVYVCVCVCDCVCLCLCACVCVTL